MVRRTEVTLFDDFTGEPADQTIVFGFAGSWFELDLTDENAAEMTATLARWSLAGRKQINHTGRTGASGTRTQAARDRSAAIRAWAQHEGMDIPARGRIAKGVIHAYDTRSAHRR